MACLSSFLVFFLLAGCVAETSPETVDWYARICRARPATSFPVKKAQGTPVKLFGPSWCPECTFAMSYMRRLRIPFEEVNPFDEGAGAADYRETLDEAGLVDRGNFPVLDVRGVVMTGFHPCALEEAWAAR